MIRFIFASLFVLAAIPALAQAQSQQSCTPLPKYASPFDADNISIELCGMTGEDNKSLRVTLIRTEKQNVLTENGADANRYKFINISTARQLVQASVQTGAIPVSMSSSDKLSYIECYDSFILVRARSSADSQSFPFEFQYFTDLSSKGIDLSPERALSPMIARRKCLETGRS